MVIYQWTHATYCHGYLGSLVSHPLLKQVHTGHLGGGIQLNLVVNLRMPIVGAVIDWNLKLPCLLMACHTCVHDENTKATGVSTTSALSQPTI